MKQSFEFDQMINEMIKKTLSWIETNIDFLDFKETTSYSLHLKIISELLLMCSLYKKKYGESRNNINKLLIIATNFIKGSSYIDHLVRNISYFPRYAFIFHYPKRLWN